MDSVVFFIVSFVFMVFVVMLVRIDLNFLYLVLLMLNLREMRKFLIVLVFISFFLFIYLSIVIFVYVEVVIEKCDVVEIYCVVVKVFLVNMEGENWVKNKIFIVWQVVEGYFVGGVGVLLVGSFCKKFFRELVIICVISCSMVSRLILLNIN